MSKFLLLIILTAWSKCATAQTISGFVSNTVTHTPLENVRVELSKKKIAYTNNEGKFSLPCQLDGKLVISSKGFISQTVSINNCDQVLEISLVENLQQINEILVEKAADSLTLINPELLIKTRITENEIARGTGLFMTDAINTNVPGVSMQGRTTSGGQQFNIRGYGNGTRGTQGVSSNFDGQGTKVYLNGIPVTDAEGVTLMDDIDFGSIATVDITKGPTGTIYGSAIAGTVNLFSVKPQAGITKFSEKLTLGSYGLMRSTSTISIGTKTGGILVNYGKFKLDGFTKHTASNKSFVNLIGDFKLSEKQNLNFFLGYSEGYDQRNGELTIAQYDTLDYSGNPAYVKNDAHSGMKTTRAGVNNTYKLSKWLVNSTSIFGSNQLLDNSSAGGWNDKTSLSFGFRSVFNVQLKLGEKVSLSGQTGTEVQRTNAEAISYKMSADSTDLSGYNVITSIKSNAITKSTSLGVFSDWIVSFKRLFDVNLGVGYNQSDLTYVDRLWGLTNNKPTNTTPKQYTNRYSNMISPKFGISRNFKESMLVYASYSVGYKAPVASYFYIPQTGEVNTNLKPEKGVQMEIGSKGNFFSNRLNYSVALYHTEYSDKMTTVTVQNPQNTATLYAYIVNDGAIVNNGAELAISYEIMNKTNKVFSSIKPFVNFTYSSAKYENYQFQRVGKDALNKDSSITDNYSDLTVAGLPPVVFNAGVDFATNIGFYGNVVFNYRDAMYFTSDNLHKTKSYCLLNAKLGFKKAIKQFELDVNVGATNLTNTQYYAMVFVNQLPDAYIPAPNKATFFGSIALTYNLKSK